MPWRGARCTTAFSPRHLDACEAQNTSTYPSRIYEVCKYQTKTGHFQLLQALVCGESWFKSLPEDLQKILVDTAREVGAESAADVLTEAENCEKKMVEAGLTIVEPDVEAFKTAWSRPMRNWVIRNFVSSFTKR